MSDFNYDVDAMAAQVPAELRAKVAAIGAHRLLAERHGIDLGNRRAALEKIGYLLAKDIMPAAEVRSALESFGLLTEGR